MELLTLKRVSHNIEGTYGVLLFNNEPLLVTLENPWLENAKTISCVLSGQYICTPYSSSRFPHTFEVINVPNRTNILFHKGNTMDDTRGCILTGTRFGRLNHKSAVLDSRGAFQRFINLVGSWDKFALNVLWS